MTQPDSLVVLFYICFFSHNHLLTCVVTKEDTIVWCEFSMNDGTYKPSRVLVSILYLYIFCIFFNENFFELELEPGLLCISGDPFKALT